MTNHTFNTVKPAYFLFYHILCGGATKLMLSFAIIANLFLRVTNTLFALLKAFFPFVISYSIFFYNIILITNVTTGILNFVFFYCILKQRRIFYYVEKVYIYFFGFYINKLGLFFSSLIKSFLSNERFKYLFTLIYIYMTFVFNLRHFFRIERRWILYVISCLIILISFLYFYNLCTIADIFMLYAYITIFGLALMSYDNVASIFSQFLVEHSESTFSLGYSYFLISAQKNRFFLIRRLAHTASLTALILGKTPMTSTGRLYHCWAIRWCHDWDWRFN